MTYIRRLEMRGFKSSGPRSLVVNFEKGFTVITGRNGSGKSNIADAILFAIGENNPKRLRAASGRLGGLIYNPQKSDSDAAQRPSACRVTIQFDNADRAIPVDSDLVTVTRELKHGGENTYFLNGKKTTRTALTEMLDLSGLSPDGLNIVPQSAATKVADLTPDEKRRMIEDVVGIAKFDERKSEAQRQLSQADQRLEVAMARIGEMKSTLDSLDVQRNDMVRFNLLEENLNWLRAVQTSRQVSELREKANALRATEQEMQQKLQDLTNRIAGAEGKISSVEGEKNRFIVEVIQGGGESHVDLQFQLAEVDNELNDLEGNLKEAESSIKSLEEETIPQLKQNVNAKQKEVTASNAVVRQLTADLEKQDRRHADYSERLSAVVDAIEVLRDTIAKKGKQVTRIQSRLGDLGEKLNQLELSIQTATATLSIENQHLAELKSRVDGYQGILSKLETNTQELFQVYERSTGDLSTIDDDLSGIEKRRSRLVASIEDASQVLEKAAVEVSKEETLRQMSESLAGERTGQLKLQEFCENGGVPGYVGRLSQLIKYRQSERKAVNSILGRWMGAFVVEDLHSMTQLIKAAKNLNAKAFSVVPLAEVEGTRAVSVESSAGVTGPLSEAIKCDARYAGMVNFLTGGTVLVESEAIGYMLASEGTRAVTMDGEVFEPGSKAFSVGYQEVLLNMIEGLENLEGVSEIEDAVGALKGAIQRKRSELNSAENTTKSLAKERAKKIADVASLRAEADTYGKMANRYRSIFRGLNNDYLKQAKAVERLQSKLASSTQKKEEMTRAVASLRQSVADTEALRLDQMLAELESARQGLAADIDGVRNKIAEVNLSLSRERANLENVLLRALEDNRLDLEGATEDYQAFKEMAREAPRRIRELSGQKLVLESKIQKLKDSSRQSQPVLDEFDARIRKAKEDRDALSRSFANNERELFSVQSQLATETARMDELIQRVRLMGFSEEPEVFDSSEELLSQVEAEYEGAVGSVNRGADKQYREMYVNFKNLSVRNNELENERNAIVAFIESIDSEKRKVFMTAFDRIDKEFRVIFTTLTGGEAWLELEKPDEIFTGGLLLMARFGTKPAWESLSLSGGEKSVSGVSLILALQSVQAHPFYLFDEIDSALDAVNSENLAKLMKSRSSGAQIIAITLRDTLISESDITYGVYAAGGVSRVVHYKPAEVALRRG